MKEILFQQAISEALDEEMARDETVYLIGEDISAGLMATYAGLVQKYGKERVKDTPISETAIVGSYLGAAVAGLRPVADLMVADFMYIAMDEIQKAAEHGHKLGLEIHAGHGLDYKNILPVAAIPEITEFSIGFSVVARSAIVGIERAVKEMVALIEKY